ncbi:MAG: low molecular weight protein-tyrosine-phosphatase [Neisseria sp.]|nr:low molecular weight protein-tyrosine-phosphatase [Neisseria sp.]
MTAARPVRILFVCLGNICRSPMAEFVLRHTAAERGIAHRIETASAGTSGWHDGEDMHRGTADVLRRHGIGTAGFSSRRLRDEDAAYYDCIVVMDDDNLAEVERRFGRRPGQIFKLTDLIGDSGYTKVPDPWHTGDFDETYRLVGAGARALLEKYGLL